MSEVYETSTIQGFYGHLEPNPCTIFVAALRDGNYAYCVKGSCNVNFLAEAPENGMHVEGQPDIDGFTWKCEINSEEELEEAIES